MTPKLQTFRQKFIGDRAFYLMVLSVMIPIVIQNGITNLVNVLDNVMVGQLGTESMSGVAIVNQLIFVFSLSVFGGISGPGIFTAQYHGSGNVEGVRQSFRFKLCVVAILSVIFITAFVFWDEELLSLYLHEADSGDLGLTLREGQTYLRIMLLGLPPFALSSAYAGTLRETGETMPPMKAGIAAVLVDLVFNWLLIFGKLGFPALGVAGAAIATVMARYVELLVILLWIRRHREKIPFFTGVYRSFRISRTICLRIIRKGTPLLLNELLWSMGITAINQCYSTRGLAAVAAVNITATLSNLFKIVMMASGSAIAIIVGQQLGAGRMKEARDIDNKMIFATCALSAGIGAVLLLSAPLFPAMYNTTGEVRSLATVLLRLAALIMPMQAFNNACYFTLRSGGKTVITFLFDCMFVCCIAYPAAFCAAHFTAMSVIAMFAMIQCLDIVKSIIGLGFLKKGTWLANIV